MNCLSNLAELTGLKKIASENIISNIKAIYFSPIKNENIFNEFALKKGKTKRITRKKLSINETKEFFTKLKCFIYNKIIYLIIKK